MKTLKSTLWALCALSALCLGSCNVADNATGTNVKAGTADPNGGPLGSIITQVDGFIPGPYNFIGKGLLAAIALYQSLRLKNAQAATTAANNVIDATSAGLQTFAKANPSVAEALADHIQAAHAAAGAAATATVSIMNAVTPPKV